MGVIALRTCMDEEPVTRGEAAMILYNAALRQ
jgi:hypothetical protein